MGGVFISYRRDDTGGYAGRLDYDLRQRFGAGRVFRDLEDIEAGVDFVEALDRAVAACGALVVLIGRHWLPTGNRSAGDIDYVSLEIEKAFEEEILVIPVLVGGATMPPAGDLPAPLRRLSRLNALELSDSRWKFDVDRLVTRLEPALTDQQEAAPGEPLGAGPPLSAGHWSGPRHSLRRPGRWAAAGAGAAMLGLVLAAALSGGGGGSAKTPTTLASGPPVLEFWVGWSGKDLEALDTVVDEFRGSHPGVTVNLKGGVSEDGLGTELEKGRGPDLLASSSVELLARECTSGAYQELGPHLDESGIKPEVFQPVAWRALAVGDRRCAIPYLADTVGLYYNTELLAREGIAKPPKTMSELADAARKLTKFNADGSIRVAGFVPLIHAPGGRGYGENYVARYAAAFGAPFFDGKGRAALTSAEWIDFFTWQRKLIEFYGYDKLITFLDGLPKDAGALESGLVAMELDGEWRPAFNPGYPYGTAPFPVADQRPELHGSSNVVVGMLVVPKTSRNPKLALELTKFLAADRDPLLTFAKAIRNIPTTNEALQRLLLDDDLDPNLRPFLKAFDDEDSTSAPVLPQGPSVYYGPVDDFVARWQKGDAIDLHAGLRKVNEDIDAAVSVGTSS